MKKAKTPALIAKTQPMLILKGHTGQTSPSVSERKKHPRLNGADLYVARLGWKGPSGNSQCCDTTDDLDTSSPIPSKALTGSLHDELTRPPPVSKPIVSLTEADAEKQPSVLASRPCYRCISYMNSVGIKRVFWTTDTGAWEGAKVRNLVDALDGLTSGDTIDTATALKNVFVTKHEVLMLRRIMGNC